MAEKLWGGRFKKKIDEGFEEFSKSTRYDYKLAEYDIYHSIIHVHALIDSGILLKKEGSKLIAALRQILQEIEKGNFTPDLESEDIHSDIQNRIEKKVGRLAAKLHTLRSRNDQIVFDEKVYCSKEFTEISRLINELFDTIIAKAKRDADTFFVGYTHSQRAQVIWFRDYILTYAEMLRRDHKRLAACADNLDISIGAGALAGSSLSANHYQRRVFPALVKRQFEELRNSVDNVSNRDFIIEFLSILTILQMHLSRLAEDFILYSTKEFDFLNLPEEFCTGSSLMPHKKNPDFLELVRGYTGMVYGNLMSVLVTMKGLPLAYNRDMQTDKEPLFSSVEIIKKELSIMAKFINSVTLKKENINKALKDEGLYATEIAEFLVVKKKAAFGEAHNIVGKLIRYSEENNCKIGDMDAQILKDFHPGLDPKILKEIMTPEYAVSSKQSVSRKIPSIKNNRFR